MRGVIVLLVLAFALAGCATGRSVLEPTGATTVVRPVSRPTGPMPAEALASRLGLGYSDADSHVLLADSVTRVRIWKNSNELSVGGETVRLTDRTSRQGHSVLVPSSMVSYVESKVGQQRMSLAAPIRRVPTAAYVMPVIAQPKPAASPKDLAPKRMPAQAPASCVPAPEAGWEPCVRARGWKWIVLHHSDDVSGDLAKYDRIHRETNGWDECGYHFVIGNGSASGDGRIEVGSRWYKQKHGAHAKTPDNRFNDYGIGICLVGDFESGGRPTAAQMEATARLCSWLMHRFSISQGSVIGHCDCKATACPGKLFPWGELRARLPR